MPLICPGWMSHTVTSLAASSALQMALTAALEGDDEALHEARKVVGGLLVASKATHKVIVTDPMFLRVVREVDLVLCRRRYGYGPHHRGFRLGEFQDGRDVYSPLEVSLELGGRKIMLWKNADNGHDPQTIFGNWPWGEHVLSLGWSPELGADERVNSMEHPTVVIRDTELCVQLSLPLEYCDRDSGIAGWQEYSFSHDDGWELDLRLKEAGTTQELLVGLLFSSDGLADIDELKEKLTNPDSWLSLCRDETPRAPSIETLRKRFVYI